MGLGVWCGPNKKEGKEERDKKSIEEKGGLWGLYDGGMVAPTAWSVGGDARPPAVVGRKGNEREKVKESEKKK